MGATGSHRGRGVESNRNYLGQFVKGHTIASPRHTIGSIGPWRGKKRPDMAERKKEDNPNWKGDSVSYFGLHSWIRRNWGKASQCEHCKKPKSRYEWASVNSSYTRNRGDWLQLCRSCHLIYDYGIGARKSSTKNEQLERGKA